MLIGNNTDKSDKFQLNSNTNSNKNHSKTMIKTQSTSYPWT